MNELKNILESKWIIQSALFSNKFIKNILKNICIECMSHDNEIRLMVWAGGTCYLWESRNIGNNDIDKMKREMVDDFIGWVQNIMGVKNV